MAIPFAGWIAERRGLWRLAIVACLICPSARADGACRYVPLDPGTGRVTIDGRTIDLGEADSLPVPGAWQGPIAIAGVTRCVVDPAVAIVERPIFQDGRHMLVTTYSGSNRTIFAIELPTCRVVWRSAAFAGAVRLTGDTLFLGKTARPLGPNCLP